MSVPHVLARIDRGAKSTQMMPKGSKPWSQVSRRVTIDQDTNEMLDDEIVDVNTVVRRALEGPRNLVTVFHYTGKEVDIEQLSKASGGKKTFKSWRTCTEEEERRLKQILVAREQRSPRVMNGTWIGQFGEVIVVSTKTNKTVGLGTDSKALSDVWSRSVYASETNLTAVPASRWICYESEVMISNDVAVRTGVGKEVAVLVEIYEPKVPAAVVRVEPPNEAVPVVTMRRLEPVGDDEDLSEAEERAMVATWGVASEQETRFWQT